MSEWMPVVGTSWSSLPPISVQLEPPLVERHEVRPRLEQHLLEGCGHWLQSEDGARVNALLLDFLARHYAAD